MTVQYIPDDREHPRPLTRIRATGDVREPDFLCARPWAGLNSRLGNGIDCKRLPSSMDQIRIRREIIEPEALALTLASSGDYLLRVRKLVNSDAA